MNGRQVLRTLAWLIRAFGRALVGAIAGLILVLLTLFIATDYFRLFSLENRALLKVVGVGSITFALLAAVSGKTKIQGRPAAAISGVLAGTMFGVIAGVMLGSMALPGVASKGGRILGIFLGGPLGAIVGGIIGVVSYKPAGKKQSRLTEAIDFDGRGIL